MAGRWARTSSLPEGSRVRQNCPLVPVTLQDWRLHFRGGRWIFPAVFTDIKRAACCLAHSAQLTKNSSSLQSIGRWFERNTDNSDVEDLWGKTVRRSQVDEVKVGSDEARRGEKWGTRGSPFLLGIGGLRLVEVTGTAVGVVVWHVDGGTIQIEVAATRTAGGEAADWTSTPDRSKVTKQLKPLLLYIKTGSRGKRLAWSVKNMANYPSRVH